MSEFFVVPYSKDTYVRGLEPRDGKLVDALGKRQVFGGFTLGLKRFQRFLIIKSLHPLFMSLILSLI